jgi:hypothetical protein
MFKKRLGAAAPQTKLACAGGHGCPDVLELKTGDFAIIGSDITEEARAHLPAGSGVGPGERVVKIPRHLLVAARADIPLQP